MNVSQGLRAQKAAPPHNDKTGRVDPTTGPECELCDVAWGALKQATLIGYGALYLPAFDNGGQWAQDAFHMSGDGWSRLANCPECQACPECEHQGTWQAGDWQGITGVFVDPSRFESGPFATNLGRLNTVQHVWFTESVESETQATALHNVSGKLWNDGHHGLAASILGAVKNRGLAGLLEPVAALSVHFNALRDAARFRKGEAVSALDAGGGRSNLRVVGVQGEQVFCATDRKIHGRQPAYEWAGKYVYSFDACELQSLDPKNHGKAQRSRL